MKGSLIEFYNGDIPGYVLKAGKSFLVIRISDWRGDQNLKITIKDVAKYYATQANNIISGCRELAGYISDWRPIHYLAQECLEWFKHVNIDQLRREGRKQGLTPKF